MALGNGDGHGRSSAVNVRLHARAGCACAGRTVVWCGGRVPPGLGPGSRRSGGGLLPSRRGNGRRHRAVGRHVFPGAGPVGVRAVQVLTVQGQVVMLFAAAALWLLGDDQAAAVAAGLQLLRRGREPGPFSSDYAVPRASSWSKLTALV